MNTQVHDGPVYREVEIGRFFSTQFGAVILLATRYATGGLAIKIEGAKGAPIGTLSVNPEDEKRTPTDPKFYCKAWSENAILAREAYATGLFEKLPHALQMGYGTAQLWQIKDSEKIKNLARVE